METRIYPTRDLDVQKIAQALVNEYQAQGFEAQQFGDSNQATVQLKKENTLRTITGFNKALGIAFQRSGDETQVQVGASDWVDQIAVGAVGLVLHPLLVTAAIRSGPATQCGTRCARLHRSTGTPATASSNAKHPSYDSAGMSQLWVPAHALPSWYEVRTNQWEHKKSDISSLASSSQAQNC